MKLKSILFFLLAYCSYNAIAEPRDDFYKNVVSIKYPILISFLKSRGSNGMHYEWDAADGTRNQLEAMIMDNGSILFSTFIYSNTNEKLVAMIIDHNQDAKPDESKIITSKGKIEELPPNHQATIMLWDTMLALTLNKSGCCGR